MVRASRNLSNRMRAAVAADRPPLVEQVEQVSVGLGPAGMEHVTVRTGRLRRPSSVGEWTAQRLASFERVRRWPAARALIGLLEAGEDADVTEAGRELDEWQRHGVRLALDELVTAARQEYPPAAVVVERIRREWIRKWGNAEPYRQPRTREAPRHGGARPASMVDSPPDASHVAAAWGRLGTATAAKSPGMGA